MREAERNVDCLILLKGNCRVYIHHRDLIKEKTKKQLKANETANEAERFSYLLLDAFALIDSTDSVSAGLFRRLSPNVPPLPTPPTISNGSVETSFQLRQPYRRTVRWCQIYRLSHRRRVPSFLPLELSRRMAWTVRPLCTASGLEAA